jgi:acetate kinase
MTAVANGKAIDHSMGLTPLEGLMMGTRSGDLDPAVLIYMNQAAGLSVAQLDVALNKKSGLLGVSGVSNDMRDCLAAADSGNQNAALAVRMFIYRVAKYIGSYYTILPGCDAVVLTGGVGENSLPVRWGILQSLARLGVKGDEKRNQETVRGKAGPITTDDSPLSVWVVPTNEELMIARDTKVLVERG